MGSYLDKAPGIDVTEDTVFSSTAHAERFLATVYRYAVHSNLPYFTEGWEDPSNYDGTLSSGATDESETCAAWYSTQHWNSGSLTADEIQDHRYKFRWIALRQIAIMIERIHDVPDIFQCLCQPDYRRDENAPCAELSGDDEALWWCTHYRPTD